MLYSPHFSSTELGGDGAPAAVQGRLQTLARTVLEPMRAALGVPLRVTSGYRPADRDPSGAHRTGGAADVVPVGLDAWTAYQRLAVPIAAGQLTFGELGFYTADRHLHVTLPGVGGDRQTWVKVGAEGADYRPLTPDTVALLPGAPATVAEVAELGPVLASGTAAPAAIIAGLVAVGLLLWRRSGSS